MLQVCIFKFQGPMTGILELLPYFLLPPSTPISVKELLLALHLVINPGGAQRTIGMLEIGPGSAMCKANNLSTVLCLWPSPERCLMEESRIYAFPVD